MIKFKDLHEYGQIIITGDFNYTIDDLKRKKNW